MSGAEIETLLLVSSRWVAYAPTFLILGVPGACLVRAWSSASASPDRERALDRRVVMVGLWSARVAVLMLGWRLFAQTYSNFGLEEPVTWHLAGVVLTKTMWGDHLIDQAWTLAAVMAGFEIARRLVWLRWIVGPAAAVALAMVTPLTSHAANHGAALWRLHVVHLIGAGLWIGTLGVFALTGFERWLPRLRTYSPIAIVGLSLALASGAAMTWRHIQPWPEAWSTPFGKALAAKIAAVVLTMAWGAVNWRMLRPRVDRAPDDERARRTLRRGAWVEVLIGFLVVVGLTSILTGLAMPTH